MTTTEQRRTGADRLARTITEVLAPPHLVIGLLVVVGAASHRSAVIGALWGLAAALFVGVLPYAGVLLAVRRGNLSSRNIPERVHRLAPIVLTAVSVAVGVTLLVLLGAPRDLVALVGAMLAGLAATGLVTTVWKISMHTAVAAGASVILALVFGPWLLLTLTLPIGVGWSRVHPHAHTLAQVIAGGILGGVIAAAIFIPLR